MMRRVAVALTFWFAACGVGVAATTPGVPGFAVPKFEQREWAISVRLTENTSWSGSGQQTIGDCTEDVVVSGSEQTVYDTPVAGRLRVTVVGPIVSGGGSAAVKGEATRHSRARDAFTCPDGAATLEGATDGCGTHPYSGNANVNWDAKKQRLTIATIGHEAGAAFERCKPAYLNSLGSLKIEVPLRRKELFSKVDHISKKASPSSTSSDRQWPFFDIRSSTSATVSVELWPVGGDPVAVPGRYRPVLRGTAVSLNGSRSHAKNGSIASYRWSFSPGPGCPQGTTLRSTQRSGARVSVKLLCAVVAELKVTDNRGQTDTKSTVIGVTPRSGSPWKTPFVRTETLASPGRGFTAPPTVIATGGGGLAVSVQGGLNTTDCGAESPGSMILCPVSAGASRRGNGFEIARFSDPGGPFDQSWWVTSATIDVRRVELINPTLTPGVPVFPNRGSFYDENVARGNPVGAFLEAIKQHEGLGKPGVAKSGHSQIIRDLIKDQDPRGEAEKLFAQSEQQAQKRVDDVLLKIDDEVDKASNDPLPNIFNSGPLAFWDESRATWQTAATFHVP
jgi:hypothetical protein